MGWSPEPELDQVHQGRDRFQTPVHREPRRLEVAGQLKLTGEVTTDDAHTARHSDRQTAHDAGARSKQSRSRLMPEVLRALQAAGVDGMTDDELARALPDDHPGSVSKRRGDLVRRGEVRDSGRTRPTRFGVEAAVWEIVR